MKKFLKVFSFAILVITGFSLLSFTPNTPLNDGVKVCAGVNSGMSCVQTTTSCPSGYGDIKSALAGKPAAGFTASDFLSSLWLDFLVGNSEYAIAVGQGFDVEKLKTAGIISPQVTNFPTEMIAQINYLSNNAKICATNDIISNISGILSRLTDDNGNRYTDADYQGTNACGLGLIPATGANSQASGCCPVNKPAGLISGSGYDELGNERNLYCCPAAATEISDSQFGNKNCMRRLSDGTMQLLIEATKATAGTPILVNGTVSSANPNGASVAVAANPSNNSARSICPAIANGCVIVTNQECMGNEDCREIVLNGTSAGTNGTFYIMDPDRLESGQSVNGSSAASTYQCNTSELGACFSGGQVIGVQNGADGSINVLRCNADDPTRPLVTAGVNGNVNDTVACLRSNDGENFDLCKQCRESGGTWSGLGCVDSTPTGIITWVIRIAYGVMGGVALIQFIIAGIYYQTGQEEKVREARKNIIATITGLAVLTFSVLILRIIGINILDILPAGSV